MSALPMVRMDGAGECAVWRIWSTDRPTASAAWAAEASCAPLHSIGFRIVAMARFSRFVAGAPWPGGLVSTVGHGEPVDLYQCGDDSLRQDAAEAGSLRWNFIPQMREPRR